MAKKAAGTPKGPKATLRTAEVLCTRRGCGQMHRICLETAKPLGAEDWLSYVCPKVYG